MGCILRLFWLYEVNNINSHDFVYIFCVIVAYSYTEIVDKTVEVVGSYFGNCTFFYLLRGYNSILQNVNYLLFKLLKFLHIECCSEVLENISKTLDTSLICM